MTRDETIAFFTRRLEYWRASDSASLAAGHAPDGTLISPMFGTVVGRTDIERAYRKLFDIFHDWVIDHDELLVDGDKVAQFYVGHGVHAGDVFGVAPTGRRIETHGVFFCEMKHGLIGVEKRYYDFSSMLIQLGVLRAKPG